MNDPISRAEALLQNSETVTLAANGADGYPHAYVMTKLPGEGIHPPVGGDLTGLEGRYVKLEDTLRSFETILGGELDKYPEAAFSNVGNVDEVIAKAKKMGAV